MNTDDDPITEVAIDEEGRLLITPSRLSYSMIYREAAEVHWDPKGKFLYSPKPREWSYLDWFRHMVKTAGYLVLADDTKWTNVPDDLRFEAEKWMRTRR